MNFDFLKDKNKKIHFIGIGGISMSGLAEILLKNGYIVTGSDMKASAITDRLIQKGAKIYEGHKSSNVENVDLVVYTAAISEDNPELIRAKELNIPLMDRADFLGRIMKGHKYNVAVSGTHGKTTTTSLISKIVLSANLDPTILVGGSLDAIGGNVRASNSEYFITEACEYKASFLKFYPYIGVVLNIDADHLDFYKDINDIQNTFSKFVNLIPEDGYLVANADDVRVMEVAKNAKCKIKTFGIQNGDVIAKNIEYNYKGCASFDAYYNDNMLTHVDLNILGEHNILNALASICTSICLNIDEVNIKEGLSTFNNAHRRFELKGVKNGITIVDDYAHHPTEIKATLKAALNYPHNNIYCVFQPHTYSRTQKLFDDFTKAFDDCHSLILMDIYAAREKDTGVISSKMLGDAIRDRNIDCINLHIFEDAVNYLIENTNNGDMIITIGAGDVYKIGEMFLNGQE